MKGLYVGYPLGTMSGGDQQAEDQCGHGRDQPHHQLDDVFGVRVQMVDRQSGVQEESCQRPKKRASEYEHGATVELIRSILERKLSIRDARSQSEV